MRIGQTSAVVFAAKVLASAIGFVGTVYFARVLGPGIIGLYATIVALITWLQLGGKAGVSGAITKRISEGADRGEYLAAGVSIVLVATLVVVALLVVFRSAVEAYVSGFSAYSDVSIVWFVGLLFVLQVTYHIVNATLQGQHLVHVVGLLRPVRTGLITGTQFLIVFVFGFGILGLVIGHAAGLAVVSAVGIAFVSVRVRRPSLRHFRRIVEYARYSWFGELSSRTFSNADILILGLFVSSNLVGIYAVAWSLCSFLSLFGGSISSAVFPEISSVSAKESAEAAARLIEDSVAFVGFLVIPGLVGGVLLDDRLFRIYGSGFQQGTEVLGFLLVSILAYSYLSQFSTALNGLDRPDLVFRINLVFVLTNVVLNVVLIATIGWVGAAIASAFATTLGLGLSYYLLSSVVSIELPLAEVGRQVVAALGMGIVVWGLMRLPFAFDVVQHNSIYVLGLVTVGAITYVAILFAVSGRFRTIVDRNLPIDVRP